MRGRLQSPREPSPGREPSEAASHRTPSRRYSHDARRGRPRPSRALAGSGVAGRLPHRPRGGSAAGSMSGLVASRFGSAGRPAARPPGATWRSPRSPRSTRWRATSSVPSWPRWPSSWRCGPATAMSNLVTEELATAFPRPTDRLAVFVHGLAETDLFVAPAGRRSPALRPAAEGGLRLHPGLSPLQHRPPCLRQRPGLADLLGRLLASWPVPVSDLAAGRPLDGRAGDPQRLSLRRAGLQRPGTGAAQVRQRLLPGRLRQTAACVITGSTCRCSAGRSTTRSAPRSPPTLAAGRGCGRRPARPACQRRQPSRPSARPVPRPRGFGGMHHFDLLNHPAVWATMRGHPGPRRCRAAAPRLAAQAGCGRTARARRPTPPIRPRSPARSRRTARSRRRSRRTCAPGRCRNSPAAPGIRAGWAARPAAVGGDDQRRDGDRVVVAAVSRAARCAPAPRTIRRRSRCPGRSRRTAR